MKHARHDAKGRSTGRMTPQAAKHFKLKEPFVGRWVEMLESPAMRVLSLSGRRLLDRLEIEHMRHAGTENGNLVLTYENLVEFGIDRHAIGPAIREAAALGFLEVTEQGRAGNREFRRPNRFRLTYVGTTEADPTDDWGRIETMDEARQRAGMARIQKAKTSGGKRPKPVRKPNTEKQRSPVGETHTTAIPEKPTLLSISRGGRA